MLETEKVFTIEEAKDRMMLGPQCKKITDFLQKKSGQINFAVETGVVRANLVFQPEGSRSFMKGLVALCETNMIRYERKGIEKFTIRLDEGPGKIKDVIISLELPSK